MKILFWGAAIFGAFFLVHLVIWKVRLPRRQVKTILLILFGGLAASLTALARLPAGFSVAGIAAPRGAAELLHVAVFVTSLILAYMITYTALEADSPSLVMTMRIQAAGSGGLSERDLETAFNDEIMVVPRIKDLLTDKMAFLSEGRYRLTPKGRILARIFISYRAVLGLPKGG